MVDHFIAHSKDKLNYLMFYSENSRFDFWIFFQVNTYPHARSTTTKTQSKTGSLKLCNFITNCYEKKRKKFVLEYRMLHTNFQGHRTLDFYHIWAWQLYWSCDLDYLNKFSFLYRMEAPLAIWLQRFLRKRRLKMLNLSELGPRSMNDLDLWYSYRLIYSFT